MNPKEQAERIYIDWIGDNLWSLVALNDHKTIKKRLENIIIQAQTSVSEPCPHCASAKEVMEKAKEVLKFYSDQRSYQATDEAKELGDLLVILDSGDRAREALALIEEWKGKK